MGHKRVMWRMIWTRNLAAILIASVHGIAFAQVQSQFDRGRNIGVADRSRPEYDARGARIGGFLLNAEADIGVLADSNIFAAENGRSEDVAFRIAPRFSLANDGARLKLRVFGEQQSLVYAQFGGENQFTGNIGFDTHLSLGSGEASAGFIQNFQRESRNDPSSPLAAARPIAFQVRQSFVGLKYGFNRLTLSTRLDRSDYNFRDAQTAGGGVIDQDFRDRSESSVSARLDYALSPDTSLVFEGTGNVRAYRLLPPLSDLDRNSKGLTLLGGVNTDLTDLLRGEVTFGYLRQLYRSPQIADLSAFAVRGKLDWFPTSLITVKLSGERSVRDTGTIDAASFLLTQGTLGVDYELRRDLLIDVSGEAGSRRFRGIERNDTLRNAKLGARYLVNRHLSLRLGYEFDRRGSAGAQAGEIFTIHRVGLTLTNKL